MLSGLQSSNNVAQTVQVYQSEVTGCSQGSKQVGWKKGQGRSRKGRDHRADEQDCWVQCDNMECAKWRKIPKSHMKYANPRTNSTHT